VRGGHVDGNRVGYRVGRGRHREDHGRDESGEKKAAERIVVFYLISNGQ